LSAKDLPGRRTERFNVRRIQRINRHPVERDEDSAPERILDPEDSLNWNGDLDNRNGSEDDCGAEVESNLEQDDSIDDPDCPEQRHVSTGPNVSGLIQPTQNSKRQDGTVLMMVNAIKTRRNKGVMKNWDRMRQCFTSFFMYLDRDF